MNSLIRILVILVLLVIIGGGAALAMWDIPAPTAKIEKVIPDATFQH